MTTLASSKNTGRIRRIWCSRFSARSSRSHEAHEGTRKLFSSSCLSCPSCLRDAQTSLVGSRFRHDPQLHTSIAGQKPTGGGADVGRRQRAIAAQVLVEPVG